MKKSDVGQAIGIVANIGVVIGIIFLAIEIRQNNVLMEADARNARDQRIQDYAEQVYMVPNLAEIILKANNGEALSELEDLKLFNRQVRLLRGLQVGYREYTMGTVEPPSETWKSIFYEGTFRNPPLVGTWEEAKVYMPPDFVQYVEDNIIEH